MPQIVTSTVVASPVGEVWALLRDFAAICDWHPALPPCEIEPLYRLRYGGSAHSFGFAIYSAARDRYEDAVLRTGLPIGTPKRLSTPPAPSTWPGSGEPGP